MNNIQYYKQQYKARLQNPCIEIEDLEVPGINGDYQSILDFRESKNSNAVISVLEDDNLSTTSVKESSFESLHASSSSQNPYANIQFEDEVTESHSINIDRATKVQFTKDCRRIFMQYMPMESKRLDPKYIDFIQKHTREDPHKRYQILKELDKYDLEIHGKIKPHFNRERSDKLKLKLDLISDKFSKA